MRLDRYIAGTTTDIAHDVMVERLRAHAKHHNKSMESVTLTADRRNTILVQEVGEVAKEINDAVVEGRTIDRQKLRNELVQVAAMCFTWIARIDTEILENDIVGMKP